MPRVLYTLFLWILLPYIFIRLWKRGRKQPDYLRHWGERFGFYPARTDEKPVIWLHAVSVGETRATVSLVAQLRAAYPQHQILFTHTTPTGRDTSVQLYGDTVQRVYFPYDYPFAVRRFFRHFRPQLGILMETEIWVNLNHAAQQEQVPLLLLNARMSAKSARGYAKFAALTRPALQGFTAIAAQTADDADRLTQLGATRVSIMGNLKFDILPPQAMLELGKALRTQFGSDRSVLLLASTREGEETLLLAAYAALPEPRPLLLIVPRHPQRFAEVETLNLQHGLRCQRRSLNQPVPAEVDVVLGDSMGELFAYYAAADIAFIGGSLLPFGGQNLIEACVVGTPVLIGQHTHNFADASRLAVEAGAAQRIHDATDLCHAALTLLHDPARLKMMSRHAQSFVEAHQGASTKAMHVITSVLPTSH
ncbi:MAG: lipid IV(A) 3-deoxy-D-manno-octulosonic acid transferase [Gallionella sp.]|nr:lipid IV(A) 3-deoxy-D-manno-octulosonic acid transferase [Gallionella sp.]MDD4960292.1 lipid IV(A) 3-deoxy-D-manno-octulosonic acid transferase [Gallionella sp.]